MYKYESMRKGFIAIGNDDWLDFDQIVRVKRAESVQRSEAKAVITVKNDPMLITTEYTFDQVWGTIQRVMDR